MKRLLSFAFVLTFGLGALGCQGNPVLVSPPSFDRPSDLAFVCVDTVAVEVVPLSRCEGTESGRDDVLALTALVTQTAAGEVAAVDLREGRGVLDVDPRVPGFTFVRVGEIPSGIVVPAEDPSLTYIANLGSKTIQSIATLHFRPEGDPPPEDVAREAVVSIPQGGPSDLLLAPAGDVLFAPIPSAGVVVQIPLGIDGTPQEPVALEALTTAVPVGVAATAPDPYLHVCGKGVTLRDPALVPPRDVGDTTGTAPRPVRLRIDHEVDPPVLLVADEGLPLIHRYSLAEGGIVALPAINVGVPVRDLAVTPLVPALRDSDVASEPSRYLYAIDDEDQSVLVIDYLEGSPTFGAVLPVNVGDGAADRITFSASARGIELMMPEYPDGAPCEHDSEEALAAAPDVLRGVFLGVTLADGTLRVVDVYDLDAKCRGGDNGGVDAEGTPDDLCCAEQDDGCLRPNPSDQQVFIRRHRPRIVELLTSSFTASTPTLSFEGSPGTLDRGGAPTVPGPSLEAVEHFVRMVADVPDAGDAGMDAGDGGMDASDGDMDAGGPDAGDMDAGSPDAGDMDADMPAAGDELMVATACPPSMQDVFPVALNDESSLVCVLTDPWSTRGERWQAIWEGGITGASGGRARFVGGTLVQLGAGSVSPCDRGVLGATNTADLDDSEPEAGYVGDQLVITSDVPPSREDDPSCEQFLTTDTEPTRDPPLAFAINRSMPDRFELAAAGTGAGGTLEQAQHCFPELFAYQVFTRETYAVTGSTTGFLHRVTEGVLDGVPACVVDTAQVHDPADTQTHRYSRAVPGRTFTNPFVAFRISSELSGGGVLTTGVDARLSFVVTSVPGQLAATVGLLPESVFYNPTDNGLYVVDVSGEAMMRFDMNPFRRQATYE